MENFKQFSIEYFVSKAHNLRTDPDDQYILVYYDILEFIHNIEEFDRKAVVAIAHIVYGWMPTILHCKFSNEDNYEYYKENIKVGNDSIEFLNLIKERINNSIVGGSKFLHFLNPKMYAIWDSNVYKTLFDKDGPYHNINSVENYHHYNSLLRDLSQKPETNIIQSILRDKKYTKKEITNMRALETVLFYSNE
ncbi:hypothetical protein MAL08_16780 [Leptospira noguchii]|uniref:hypothetical protein n=1 Tax=Leptospira noguchii TaxID=28182 RepID=UPI001FB7ED5E|nr:hypothetical protein [Leptospira noguchii]UOG37652.1 hypothetical protein MAL08_16780 [Leptospira noguchii]